jgi:hypothetical protein
LHIFLLGIISTKRQRLLMDVKRQVLLSSNDFPSTIDSTTSESTVGYSRFGIWRVFIDFAILVELKFQWNV